MILHYPELYPCLDESKKALRNVYTKQIKIQRRMIRMTGNFNLCLYWISSLKKLIMIMDPCEEEIIPGSET